MEEPIKFSRVKTKTISPLGTSIFATKQQWTIQIEGQEKTQEWMVQPTLSRSCFWYSGLLKEYKTQQSVKVNPMISLVDSISKNIWHIYGDWYQLGDDWTKLHHWSPSLEAEDFTKYEEKQKLKDRMWQEVFPHVPKGYCMYAYAGEKCPKGTTCPFQHVSKQDYELKKARIKNGNKAYKSIMQRLMQS